MRLADKLQVIFVQLMLVLMLIMTMTSCGGGHHKPVTIENPYASRAQGFINNGKTAMQQEHWQAAEQSFSRALMAAQLADNTPLISQSWYNTGMAHAAMGHYLKAKHAYSRTIRLAEQHKYDVIEMRARLALTLLNLHSNMPVSDMALNELFSKRKWPVDIYLQVARIAQLQKQPVQAKYAYNAVLNFRDEGKVALKMKAEAHMGLALLAKSSGEWIKAHDQADKTLAICHRIGAARLTAHALLLKGQLPGDSDTYDVRRDQLVRALDIYLVLEDIRGQKQSLIHLGNLAAAAEDKQAVERIQLRLKALDDKLVQ